MSGWHCAAAALTLMAPALGQTTGATEVPAQPGTQTKSSPAPSAPPPAAPVAISAWTLEPPDALRAFGVESWWDVVRMPRWTGTLGVMYDSQDQRLQAPAVPGRRNTSQLTSQTATLRNDGFALIDPRLFTGSLSVGLTLQQQEQRSNESDASQQATLLNYSFDGIVLPERPYSLNLSALRSQSTYVLPSGTTTKSDNQGERVALVVRENNLLRDREILPYFSANLSAQQQHLRQTTTTGGQFFRQDDQRDQLAFDFHNGGLTSDLNFQYQFNRLDNFAFPQGSYDSQSGNLVYSLDFGPTLNRRWDSRINYYNRTGETELADLSNLEVNQFLTIDHNVDRSSFYNYQLTRQSTAYGATTTQIGSAQVQQQVYSNLSVSGSVFGQHVTLPGGTISAPGAAASVSYNRMVPWEGQLNASAGASGTVTTSDVGSGAVQVRDAPYAVPPVLGAGNGVLLADRNIVTETIVVVVLKGAARILAVLNVDYQVEVIGDRTRILPLPSSALMLPGDPLYISYVFEVAADSQFRTIARSLSFGIDWPRIGFTLSHDESEQTPLAGADNALLVDQRRDAGKIYVNATWNEFQARASVGFVRYDSTRLKYVERRADEYLSYRPYQNLHFNLAANQYWTEYDLPAQSTNGTSLRLDATWTWFSSWLTSAYAGTRSYHDSEQPSERIDELGFRVRRTWTLLDVDVFAGTQRRKRGETSSTNTFLHCGAVRRF